MRFHNIYTPEVGGYAGPDPYGYYGQPEQPYGYYGYTDPTFGYYGQPEQIYGYGYYGQPEQLYGYYGQSDPLGYVDPTYGYYGQAQEPASWDGYGYYGDYPPEAVGYYADEYPVGDYTPDPAMMGYGQVPEMVGYGEPDPYAQGYPGVSYYGESGYSGYVRDVPPPFNAGCPLPTNVSGFEDEGFDGFVRPKTVNPTCTQFIEQPGSPTLAPDTFKPLW